MVSIVFILLISSAAADVNASISVTDENGNEISGKTVLIGTKANVSGYYEDPTHGLTAAASLSAWFKGPGDPGFIQEAILFSGWIDSPSTITKEYELGKYGTYKFKWEVENVFDEAVISTTTFVIPEFPIGTLLGIVAPFTAVVGLFALKKFKAKRQLT